MSKFVLNRDYVLNSDVGLSVRFIKGEPVFVPKPLEKLAVSIGAECVDGEVDVLPPEKEPEPELTPEELQTLLFAAFEQMEVRDERGDFTGQGIPAMKPVEAIVGRNLERAQVTDAWEAYVQAKAE